MLRISGLNREEVIGGWRKLHNKELHNSYSSCILHGQSEQYKVLWSQKTELEGVPRILRTWWPRIRTSGGLL
jgi:hypothetical protein